MESILNDEVELPEGSEIMSLANDAAMSSDLNNVEENQVRVVFAFIKSG